MSSLGFETSVALLRLRLSASAFSLVVWSSSPWSPLQLSEGGRRIWQLWNVKANYSSQPRVFNQENLEEMIKISTWSCHFDFVLVNSTMFPQSWSSEKTDAILVGTWRCSAFPKACHSRSHVSCHRILYIFLYPYILKTVYSHDEWAATSNNSTMASTIVFDYFCVEESYLFQIAGWTPNNHPSWRSWSHMWSWFTSSSIVYMNVDFRIQDVW